MKSLTKASRLNPLALAISLAVAASPVLAETDEINEEDIETIVVVGQTTNSEVTAEELEKFQANDLSDIFRTIPSVSVGGSLGIAQKIYIRGMEDTLLNVTVDGAPQTGTLFHHIGRVAIEPELLKEVEVQAGAGEATAGAGAIGGAIRFKTKDVDDLLEPGEKFGATIKAGYFSNDGYKTSATLYGALSDSWGILGSYIYVDNENMEDGSGKEIMGTSAEQSLAFIKLNGEISEGQNLTLSYENREEDGEYAQRPNWNPMEGVVLFPMDGERETIVANYTYAANEFLNVEATLYSTENSIVQDVYTRWGKYRGEMKSTGFDIRNTTELADHTLTYGIEYRKDKVSSGSLEPDAAPGHKEEGTVSSVYFQDHWQLTADLLFSFGARYDDYDLEQISFDNEISSDGFSPNLGFNYTISDNWLLTLGYAEAMRGKLVGDSFTIESATIDPNLKPEEVTNKEVGLTYHNDNWQVVASYYQSDIEDVIKDKIFQGIYYENIGKLETDGFELKAGYNKDGLNIVASYNNNSSELNGHTVEGYEENGLANERGDTWNLNVSYILTDTLEFGWNYTLVEDLNNIEALFRSVELGWLPETQYIDKEGYQVHDIYLQWQPLESEELNINFAVQNLFDEHYRDHSSVGDYSHVPGWEIVSGLYEPGRDIRVSVSYSF